MNYPFILKFSSISNLSDARYAAGSFADFVGFCFDPAEGDYLEPGKAIEIAGWINGPMIVGEFGMQPWDWISDFVRALSLKAIQVPAEYSDNAILGCGLRLIVKVYNDQITPLLSHADILVAHTIEIYDLLKKNYDKPVIIDIRNNPVIAENYDGIELKGIKEEEPGTRDHKLWNEILEPYQQ